MAREQGIRAEERKISVDEWRSAIQEGRMTEAFACGTAAVITPVGRVKSRAGEWLVGTGETGPVTAHLRRALLDIQTGQSADSNGWLHRLR